VHFVASVPEVGDFICLHGGFYAAEFDSASADVDRDGVLGEHAALVVAAKDARRGFARIARL